VLLKIVYVLTLAVSDRVTIFAPESVSRVSPSLNCMEPDRHLTRPVDGALEVARNAICTHSPSGLHTFSIRFEYGFIIRS